MTKHLGKRPASYRPETLRFSDFKSSIPSLPKPHFGGYGNIFKSGSTTIGGWGMMGNGPCDDGSITDPNIYAYNGAGDCAWAGPAHETMEADKNSGRNVASFTCANVLNQYAQYLGLSSYKDLNAQNDAGSDVQEVLKYRATTGLLDVNGNAHKIAAFVSLEPANLTDLWEALYLFEQVGIGINFPESADAQYEDHQIWSVVPGAQIEGGHYIPLVGRPTENVWTCVTWGRRQTMTQAFLTKYCDEAYAWISTERYNAVTGETLEKYDDADLSKYLSMLGQSA